MASLSMSAALRVLSESPKTLHECATCGEPTRGRWCSEQCWREEDGPEWGDDD